jgi:hypothetical protein
MVPQVSYPHRRNSDGTFDSICTKCFLTVAHRRAEAELAAIEEAHICNSAFLADCGRLSDSFKTRQSA